MHLQGQSLVVQASRRKWRLAIKSEGLEQLEGVWSLAPDNLKRTPGESSLCGGDVACVLDVLRDLRHNVPLCLQDWRFRFLLGGKQVAVFHSELSVLALSTDSLTLLSCWGAGKTALIFWMPDPGVGFPIFVLPSKLLIVWGGCFEETWE